MNANTDTAKVKVVFTPSGKKGEFAKGTPILQAARQLGVDLESVCGGRGICGRCQVVPGFGDFAKHGIKSTHSHVSPFNAVEERYRDKKGLQENRRLGCSCQLLGDMVMDIPADSQVHKQVIRKRAEARNIEINPVISLYYVEVTEPDIHHPSGDLERIFQALSDQWDLEIKNYNFKLLPDIQTILRKSEWKITCVVRDDNHLAAIWPGFEDKLYGLAIDVGSTTMSIHITDLHDGEVIHSTGAMNPQIRFGEDLMSRVSYAMMNEKGDKEMCKAVRETLAHLIIESCQDAGIDKDKIMELVMVGNPIMHHLILGVSPVELGWAPFALVTNSGLEVNAYADLDLPLHTGARAYFLPCVAGHVGADAAAVVLSETPYQRDEICLIIDVGTNAEIVLGNMDRLLACSSPTGPALEGAQISSGQRDAAGAIEKVRIDKETGEPIFRVIGSDLWSNEEGFNDSIKKTGVTGICGSGIIEVIGEMMLAELMTRDGIIDGDKQENCARIVADGRTFSYILHYGDPEIRVTQADIRAIQLAKAALYAGAQLLVDKLGKRPDRIILAGAFGSHIENKYAMLLGLVPDCELDKVQSAGNAAGTGARIALLNVKARREIESVVSKIEKIETALEADFQQHFVEAMAFPHKTAAYPHLEEIVELPGFKEKSGQPSQKNDETSGRANRRRRRRV